MTASQQAEVEEVTQSPGWHIIMTAARNRRAKLVRRLTSHRYQSLEDVVRDQATFQSLDPLASTDGLLELIAAEVD